MAAAATTNDSIHKVGRNEKEEEEEKNSHRWSWPIVALVTQHNLQRHTLVLSSHGLRDRSRGHHGRTGLLCRLVVSACLCCVVVCRWRCRVFLFFFLFSVGRRRGRRNRKRINKIVNEKCVVNCVKCKIENVKDSLLIQHESNHNWEEGAAATGAMDGEEHWMELAD